MNDLALQLSSPGELALDGHTKVAMAKLLSDGTPKNTRRAYVGDMRSISRWFNARFGVALTHERLPLSVEQVITYITDHLEGMPAEVLQDLLGAGAGAESQVQTHRYRTVARRLSSLSMFHDIHGHLESNPVHDRRVLLLKRKSRIAKRGEHRSRDAITLDILQRLIETCGDSLLDARDRALLTVGFAAGGRRSEEIARFTVENLRLIQHPDHGKGYELRLPHAKTDQEGEGRVFAFYGFAVEALDRWLELSQIREGRLFRSFYRGGRVMRSKISERSITSIVKNRAELAGLNPTALSAHSLRHGFITECGRQNHSLQETMQQSDHSSVSTVMVYYRAGAAANNPVARLTVLP